MMCKINDMEVPNVGNSQCLGYFNVRHQKGCPYIVFVKNDVVNVSETVILRRITGTRLSDTLLLQINFHVQ